MSARTRRASRDHRPLRAVRVRPTADAPPPRANGTAPASSPTAVAAEALRTGVLSGALPRRSRSSHEDETILVGDPDDRSLDNAYVGDETPGGTASTPDQSNVDDIGRAYGLQEEDSGALRSGSEVLSRRDRHRSELRAPRRPGS
jgi:uncharacterized protein DUF6335